jgi:tetratricopeptide (TPR) repeat protein
MHRRAGSWLLLVWSAACSGVSLRPERADATTLPVREVSAQDRNRLDKAVTNAMQSIVQRRFDAAEAAAGEALAIDPRNARARAVLGMVRLQHASLVDPPDLVDANAGETELLLARQLAPDDTFVGWMWAVFLAESGHTSAAAEAAEQALVRAKGAPPAERATLLGIAGIYRYELGEERAALPHLQEYVDLRPDDATAHFRLGSSLLRIAAVPQGSEGSSNAQTLAEQAAKAFERCAELAPGDEDAAVAVATAHWRASELAKDRHDDEAATRHRDAAEAHLRAVATRFPDSPEPWFRLGVIAESRSEPAAARTAYAAALQRSPRHVPTLLNLAALLDDNRETEAATALLRHVLDLDTVHPSLTPAERRRVRSRLDKALADQAPRML